MSELMPTLTKEDGQSKDLVKENIEKLKQLFPEIVTDGKIDFETLKEELGEFRETDDERYSFRWNGKSKARKLAMTPSRGTLRPAPEESVNWDSTENLFIEGDNLEVLKLLQRSYHKKVKMIYIDPPYNTGNDFVYKDDYKDNLSNYLKLTGQLDGEGKKISSNPEYSGRYHTDWLNMMYPRLKLARELLKDDGVFFISTDDNEQTNLKKICDEIFGEENFIISFSVQLNPRGRHLDKFAAQTHETILAYGKDINNDSTMSGMPKTGDMLDEYNRKDEGGKFRALGLRNRNQSFNPETRPNLFYPLYVNPNNGTVRLKKDSKHTEEALPVTSDGVKTCWTWGRNKVEKNPSLLLAEWVSNRWKVYRKDYYIDESGNKAKTLPKSLWINKEINNDYGKKAIKELFGKNVMDFPKSTYLIRKLIEIGTHRNDIVMDFFAGSCTTAQAILDSNSEDSFKNNNFIMVQLPEECDKKSNTYKAGYSTISDLGKERIRRAAQKIKEENPHYEGDLGFKVFKLDSSNIKPWDPDFDEVQLSIEDSIENVKPDRSEQDLLYEILLKYGIDLSLPIEEREIAGAKVYIGGAGALVLCPSDNITLKAVEGIAAIKEEFEPEIMRVVFRDSGFKDDMVKTNAIQILKQHGIEDVRSI
jgi:adenine-specific DNA-methyltransferase